MRQVFLDKGSVVIKEVAQPHLDDYSVLVMVHYSFVSSSTEITSLAPMQQSFFANVPQKVKKVLESVTSQSSSLPAIFSQERFQKDIESIGYSCSGHIVAVGKKVSKFRPGDLVACAGAGYAHHADFICVPSSLIVKVPNKEMLKAASLTTIGAIALHAIRRAQLQLSERVCIIGLGLLGQLSIQLAKLSGCFVVGVDVVPERISLALEHGADFALHAKQDDIVSEINMLTQEQGVDAAIVVVTSKSNDIIQQAMSITRKKGRVIVVSDVGLELERDPFYSKEIDLLASCSFGPGRNDPAYEYHGNDYPYAYVRWTQNRNMQAFIDLLQRGSLKLDAFLQHEVRLEGLELAYKKIKSKNILGVVLGYPPSNKLQQESIPLKCDSETLDVAKKVTFIPAVRDVIRLGCIGVGDFAQNTLLPILSKMRNVDINAIVDTNTAIALSVANAYNVTRSYAYDVDLFKDDLIDAVIIASPHAFHSEQALRALSRGKAVFLEKPMAINAEQLHRFEDFLLKNADARFCVDYSRPFAPFIQKVQKVISKRQTPLMMQYRVNSRQIAKDHWLQTDGLGRIIGDACQIIDLFCSLVQSAPLAVSVESLNASRDDIFPTDNFTFHISFEDGSVCSCLYTSLGNQTMGKERMEVFFDGKAIIMDDFFGLFGFGLSSAFNETVVQQDLGYTQLLSLFLQELKKPIFVPPIQFERLLLVSRLTLLIDELVCQGGGSKQL